MQGRTPKGIVVACMNCVDSSAEAQWNTWYNTVHIPDVLGPGLFSHATRYVNPQARGGAADPKYMAIYETDHADPGQAWAEMLSQAKWRKWSEASAVHPAGALALPAVFKATGHIASPPRGKRTHGILAAMIDCADPAREAEFNRWYDEVHAADVLKTGLYWSALRYVNIAPGPGQPKYLALYETEGAGPGTLAALVARPNKDPSRDLGLSVRRLVGSFNLIFSHAGSGAAVGTAGRREG